MSEYQRYRFICVDNGLDTNQRLDLRTISSRAEITSNTFSVYYHYSGLRAEPIELMAKYFDLGMYYSEWADLNLFIKLPPNTLPQAFFAVNKEASTAYNLNIYELDGQQVLVFSYQDEEHYFEEEEVDQLFAYMSALREEFLKGDLRLLYLFFLNQSDEQTTGYEFPEPSTRAIQQSTLPLINFDFIDLSSAQMAMIDFFCIPVGPIRALSFLLANVASHSTDSIADSPTQLLAKLSPQDKDILLLSMLKSGNLSKDRALSLVNKNKCARDPQYKYWLTFEALSPYMERAVQQVEQENVGAHNAVLEAAMKAKILRFDQIIEDCDSYWKLADDEAKRACASGYDQATGILRELLDAYAYRSQQSMFFKRFARLVRRHEKRKALLKRLRPILDSINLVN